MPKKKKAKTKVDIKVKLQTLRTELKANFIERADEIDGLLTALLAQEHLLLLGPPGVAKTMLTSIAADAIEGAEYFEWLMSKFSVPEELFGSFSLKALKEDRHERILDGKLPEASIAFLDEIFKANSSILNSLLTLINERKFFNGGKAVDCPLETMVGASNELPESKELDALYDRFLLRYWVDYIKDMGKFKDLLMSGPPSITTTTITLDELHEMQEGACTIPIPEKIIDLIIQLKLALEREGFVSSDRRWKKALDIIGAYAYLNGHGMVTENDLSILQHVLWNDPKDKSTLSWLISKVCTPALYAAQEILAATKEAYLKIDFMREVPDSDVSGALNEAIQLNSQIKKAISKIKKSANGNTESIQDSLDELIDMQEKVSKYAMKLSGL